MTNHLTECFVTILIERPIATKVTHCVCATVHKIGTDKTKHLIGFTFQKCFSSGDSFPVIKLFRGFPGSWGGES